MAKKRDIFVERDEHGTIVSDAEKRSQVGHALVENAIRYAPADAAIEVAVKSADCATRLQCSKPSQVLARNIYRESPTVSVLYHLSIVGKTTSR